jgi:hypothetical protein
MVKDASDRVAALMGSIPSFYSAFTPSSSTTASSSAISAVNTFASLDSIIDDLEGMSLLIEEVWLREAIEGLVLLWTSDSSVSVSSASDSKSPKKVTLEALVLRGELARLQAYSDCVAECGKLDSSLTKHVQEMESFEIQSKNLTSCRRR